MKRASHVSAVCLFVSLGFDRYHNCIFSCLHPYNRNFLGETPQLLLGFSKVSADSNFAFNPLSRLQMPGCQRHLEVSPNGLMLCCSFVERTTTLL